MDFDGASCQPDTFVVSWVMCGPEAQGRRLALGFANSVNTCHRHKATDVVEGFGGLKHVLHQRFAAIAEGRAFDTHSED